MLGKFGCSMKIIVLIFLLISKVAAADLEIISPQNHQWLNYHSEIKGLPLIIEGRTTEIISNNEVNLFFNGRKFDIDIDKKGRFKAEISLDTIRPMTENEIRVVSLKHGTKVGEQSIKVYCCSHSNFGFFSKLKPNTTQLMVVRDTNKELDGTTVNIPTESITGPANIFISIKLDGPAISRSKYSPLGLPISIGFQGDYHSSEKIEYGLVTHFDTPRDGFGEPISEFNWRNRENYDLDWSKVDLKDYKLVVLAYDGKWKELPSIKKKENKVYFKLPRNHSFDRFLPAAVLKEE